MHMKSCWESYWYGIFFNNPDAVTKDESLKYKVILSFSSFEDVKKHLINKEVELFLKNKSTEEQLKYLKKELRADIASHFSKISQFKEIFLRRHVIVHAGGKVSAEYLRRARKIKGIDLSDLTEGVKIPLTSNYVIEAWNTVCSVGVILLHLIAKDCARSNKSKQKEDEADRFLVNASFECIKNDQLDAARNILEYANRLKLAEDSSDLMVTINLAQTHKWQGDNERCQSILDSKDWNSYNSLYQLCVAALRDDEGEFAKQLIENASQDTINVADICEWPVFRNMRQKSNFSDWIMDAYGQEIKDSEDTIEFRMLHMDADDTIRRISENSQGKRKFIRSD